ncbi:MAG: STAS domain-containing protein [Chloroflexota bacterium]
MPNNTLSASVRHAGATAIIDLRGEINSFGEEVLNNAYAEANQASPKIILLNFSGVDYINSTGIALIVGLLAQARKSGQRLFTTGLSSHYVEIFQITRLSDFMNIYPDEASALAAQ